VRIRHLFGGRFRERCRHRRLRRHRLPLLSLIPNRRSAQRKVAGFSDRIMRLMNDHARTESIRFSAPSTTSAVSTPDR
jgi:hypothetical protein